MKTTSERRPHVPFNRAVTAIIFSSLLSGGCARRSEMLVCGAIWTGNPQNPAAEAMLIENGRVVRIGTLDTLSTAHPNVTRIDAGGRRIIPGLIDAHVHIVGGGLSMQRLAMRDMTDRAQFMAAVADRSRQLASGQWLLGRGWSTDSWANPSSPTRDWIDGATGDHPALLQRMDGHCALANTAALRLAGLDSPNPIDPPGGTIERDASGRPTGILKDAAISLVSRHVPEPSVEEKCAAIRAAMREANRYGVTTVNTMSEWDDVPALRRVHDEENDTLRVVIFVQEPDWEPFVERVRSFGVHDDRLRIAGFKAYMDGSLGSRTAYMHEPFADQPNNRGLMASGPDTPARLARNFRAAQAAGLQCAVHAIGDEGNHVLLDLYSRLDRNQRPRVEHAQHLLPGDIPRFAELGVVASMQPYHKADDGRYAETAIGPQRSRSSYAFADLLRSGAHVAFGSDWPVVSINPFTGIHAAVTGRTLDGKTWMVHENISVEQALGCYTRGAAFACKLDDRIGMLAPGFLADFVILETDPLSQPTDELIKTRVAATYLGGRKVWSADEKLH